MDSPIKVALVDDHQMFIEGINSILEKDEQIEVVFTALEGGDALRKMRGREVDIVVLDINMRPMDGFEFCRKISSEFPAVKKLVLTMHESAPQCRRILGEGANGYLLKTRETVELIKALKSLQAGKKMPYLGEKIKDLIAGEAIQAQMTRQGIGGVYLTTREKEILSFIGYGLTAKEIASKIDRSVETVNAHVKNLKFKLDINSKPLLVRYAIRHGYSKWDDVE